MTSASETSLTSFTEFAVAARQRIDDTLEQLLPPANQPPVSVHSAMRWSVFAGGKRFRPMLLLATGEAFGADDSSLLRVATALELIHTYSLIHDDLPCMDDDDLRRGQPTCHIKFGEATAILAGDALQTLAFQTIAEAEELSLSVRIQLISELSRAAGTPAGMVAGQALDLEAEGADAEFRGIGDAELEQIHHLKTGALIIASARCGAIIAGATDEELKGITEYARQLGLLFQITDDLLDVTATAEIIGKTPGKDARASKATYPSAFGIEAAGDRARTVHTQACAALDSLTQVSAAQYQSSSLVCRTDRLKLIADFILKRTA